MFTRRQLLAGIPVALAAASLPARVRAALPGAAGRRFLFVFAQGGWDPLTVFAPLYGSSSVDMEPGTEVSTFGNLSVVDGPARPSVRAFFEAHHARTLILNGLSVRSVSHETCLKLALSASSSGEGADWATRLGAAGEGFTLPHLVLGGPSLPGGLGDAVARAGASGQLDGLLSGRILDGSDVPARRPSPVAERILDRYLARRTAARADASRTARERELAGALSSSVERASALKDMRYEVDFAPGSTLGTQAEAAVRALAKGLSRCVTVGHPQSWDTHADNTVQSQLFEDLFAGLSRILRLLETQVGPSGVPLAEETVVVVLSEMGRTPKLNGTGGRDHWPYTSVLLVGPGLTGDRVVGAFDGRYYGRGVDPATGDAVDGAPALSVENLGATLLALGGADASDLHGGTPIEGILR